MSVTRRLQRRKSNHRRAADARRSRLRRSLVSFEALEDRRLLAGGDYSLDFAAAAPTTYDHVTGGGAFNDGSNTWAVESLEGGDFNTGDMVSYFTKITVDDLAPATTETIELEFTFGTRATNGLEIGHVEVIDAVINYGTIPQADIDENGTLDVVGQGFNETDSGIMDDRQNPITGDSGVGGSTVTIVNQVYDDGTVPDGTYPDDNLDADDLIATIRIDDLESGEMVVLRIDVLIGNGDDVDGTANIQAKLSDKNVVESDGAPVPDAIPGGAQTIPFKNVQLIVQANKTGTKFHDLNADGVQDAGEPALAGWVIQAYADLNGNDLLDADEIANGVIASDTTDVNGEYTLSLDPGDYIIVEVLQADWFQSAPGTTVNTVDATLGEFGYAITLASGQLEPDNDFGNFQRATKSGIKYEDFNADGVMNGADAGLAGWTIAAFADNDNSGTLTAGDTLADSDVTVGGGAYTLSVNPGRYIIVEELQANWFESPDAGTTLVNTFDTDYGQYGYDVTLAAGDAETGNNFANFQESDKTGTKFHDLNADGVQDAGEPALAGWVIEAYADLNGNDLLDADEIANGVIASDTTDVNGEYTLSLDPGDYIIVEMLQADWFQSAPGTSVNTVDATLGEFGYAITLTSGQPEPGNDFGNFLKSSIHGYKFNDIDADGTDDTEPRLAGVTITLTGDTDGDGDVDVVPAVTDGNGEYWFLGLFPGDYTVAETPPAGSVATTLASVDVTLTSGEEEVAEDGQAGQLDPPRFETLNTDLAFGNTFLGSIHGYKFNDLDADGTDDAEPRLAGVTITLTGDTDGDGDVDVVPAVTDGNGEYWFLGLFPGDYTVTETPPAGSVPTTLASVDVTLTSGEEEVAEDGQAGPLDPPKFETLNTDLAFGNTFLGSIHGYKFNDIDADGVDDSEPRLAGVTITLTGDTDGDGDVDVVPAVTDGNGEYWFLGLFPGDYTVTETPPAGSVPTTLATVDVTITSGEEEVAEDGQAGQLDPPRFETLNTDLAFGNTFLGSIHGYKFNDIDADGVDDTEPRLAGVTITLTGDTDGDGQVDVVPAVTDGNGEYWFLGLFPGDYTVAETPPAGSVATTLASVDVTLTSGEEEVAEEGQAGPLTPPKFETLNTDLAFGNTFLGSIHGYKFHDRNFNGIDDNEPRLEGVTIVLTGDTDGDGQVDVVPTVTDGNGEYWFLGLFPGEYTVTETPPAGSVATTLASVDVTLTSGEEEVAEDGQAGQLDPPRFETLNTDLAFGNVFLGSIHGYKFNDLNGNGIDDNDPRLEGVEITISGDTDGDGDIESLSITTGPNGEYWFTDIFPGIYDVVETPPAGSVPTTAPEVRIVLSPGEERVAEAGQAGPLDLPKFERVDPRMAFGNTFFGSIHGYKFHDLNFNGVDDAEPRLPGVEITITGDTDGDGQVESVSMPTDADGNYWFLDLYPGVYDVVETAPDGSVPTTDPDVRIVLSSGEERVAVAGQAGPLDPPKFERVDTRMAFGNVFLSSIHGYKFHDLNANGTDDAEPRLEGVEITIVGDADGDGDVEELTTLTGADGSYWFMDIYPGVYDVIETPPAGSVPTTDPDVRIVLSPGEERVAEKGQAGVLVLPKFERVDTRMAFGNTFLGSIHGYKFNDLDADGKDDADPRLEGVTVTLIGDVDGDGQVDSVSMTTDDKGEYWFLDLFPGVYTVTETPPVGSVPTTDPAVTVSISSGEEVVGEAGQAGPLAPPKFETVNEDLGFGNTFLGSIHGFKYNDLDGDGQPDPEDLGVNGVTFELTGDVDGDGDDDILYETTDKDGFFWFLNLFPGTYLVEEIVPPGSFPSDAVSATLTIISGQERVAIKGQAGQIDPPKFETQDDSLFFGNFVPPEVHGTKYHDRNANGMWDEAGEDGILGNADDEVGLPGWTIVLSGADGKGNPVDLQTVTDANGDYWFMDDPNTPQVELPPGDYTITEVIQEEWLQSDPIDGKHEVKLSSGEIVYNLDFGNFLIGKNLLIVPAPMPHTDLVNLDSGDVWLSLDGSGGGDYEALATYNAADGSVRMSLYDGDLNLIAGSADGDGDELVEWLSNGGFYLLRVYGTNPAVDLSVGLAAPLLPIFADDPSEDEFLDTADAVLAGEENWL